MTKQELRHMIREQHRDPDAGQLAQNSRQITQQLIRRIEHDAFQEYFFYHPLPGEVSLLALAAQVMQIGKRVYFPRVDGPEMEFFRVRDLAREFCEGPYHLMEPVSGETPAFACSICFVPGLAFDAQRYRLGHGKGYYDRYLAKHPGIRTIGICENRFFLPEIPHEPHDIPMDQVVTQTTAYGWTHEA